MPEKLSAPFPAKLPAPFTAEPPAPFTAELPSPFPSALSASFTSDLSSSTPSSSTPSLLTATLPTRALASRKKEMETVVTELLLCRWDVQKIIGSLYEPSYIMKLLAGASFMNGNHKSISLIFKTVLIIC
ncbi:hypothetical protein PsorP6_008825 [Peronosclerospora sorghi]|uniref:Uncharacterized protein n=1 Tax=Peronosclerospora sorghi TaxID=230839 RepID=A0ACC0VZL3_9STRA|nr:hypothetical protein PsorP6_008825 [Peronosclerospora sorghi]